MRRNLAAALSGITCSMLAAAGIASESIVLREADIAWVASGEFCEPETVLPLPDNTLLVSNVCGFDQPGTGFLTLLDEDGQILDWRVVSELDAPLGMAIAGDSLFVVDSNRVHVFRWPGYALQETIELDTKVANDIAVAADGTLYLTDTAMGRVVVITADRVQSILPVDIEFTMANGIAIDGNHLFVGGKRLWRVNLGNHSVEIIGNQKLSDIDGIEFEADGTLQVTPVGGPLIRYWSTGRTEILSGEGVSSANHGFAAKLNLALIPTGYDNTVIAIRIDAAVLVH